jgi:hypothetical protein
MSPISQNKQTYKHMLSENMKREIKVYPKIMLEAQSKSETNLMQHFPYFRKLTSKTDIRMRTSATGKTLRDVNTYTSTKTYRDTHRYTVQTSEESITLYHT